MASWTTDAIKQRERFSFWRDIVCSRVFNISSEAPPELFSGRITAWSAGPIRFATCETSGWEIARSRRDINKAPADHYTIYLQLRGQTAMEQCGESFTFQCNDIFISDGRQPFRAALSNDGFRAMAVLPRAMIDWRAPWLRRRPLNKLNSNSSFFDLARRHFVHLVSDDLSETQTSLLTDNLCNLLALTSANDIPPNRMRPELQLEAMLAFSRQNIHRSELSPRFVATHFGISVRTLHLRFEKLGQTFARWMLDTRLDACSKALRDPLQG
ncbi:MAG: hypothetical protein WBD96_14580, partial [Pseudolabrys sp.]